MTNDYIVRSKNRAKYLPAGQGGTHSIPYRTAPFPDRPEGLPDFLPSLRDLDFLDRRSNLFTYDRALYSAGQHINGSGMLSPGTFSRREGVTILTDSGGLQFARDKAPWRGNASRLDSLRFAEAHGDEAICLDIPTAAVDLGHPIFSTFQICLDTTLDNNRFWLKHQRTHTRFFAVLQGRDRAEGYAWTTAMIAAQSNTPMGGWAFGGVKLRSDYIYLAEVLLRLKGEGLLGRDRNRVHVLGESTLVHAVMLSAIQFSLREMLDDDEFLITFDTATPTHHAANGQVFREAKLTPDQFSMEVWNPPSAQVNAGDRTPWCRSSAVGCRMNIGDLIRPSPKRQNGWDGLGHELVVNHNIEALLRGIDEANSVMELPRGYQTPFAPAHLIDVYNAMRAMWQFPRDPIGHLKRSSAAFAKL